MIPWSHTDVVTENNDNKYSNTHTIIGISIFAFLYVMFDAVINRMENMPALANGKWKPMGCMTVLLPCWGQ